MIIIASFTSVLKGSRKISQSSRQGLATDAEKLYASHQLWLKHNEFLE